MQLFSSCLCCLSDGVFLNTLSTASSKQFFLVCLPQKISLKNIVFIAFLIFIVQPPYKLNKKGRALVRAQPINKLN